MGQNYAMEQVFGASIENFITFFKLNVYKAFTLTFSFMIFSFLIDLLAIFQNKNRGTNKVQLQYQWAILL